MRACFVLFVSPIDERAPMDSRPSPASSAAPNDDEDEVTTLDAMVSWLFALFKSPECVKCGKQKSGIVGYFFPH